MHPTGGTGLLLFPLGSRSRMVPACHWAALSLCALRMCLDGETKPQRDCNALSAGFLPARHGLHMGCQCESDSPPPTPTPLRQPLANFSTWPCHAPFSLALFVCACECLARSLHPSVLSSQGSLPSLPPTSSSPFCLAKFRLIKHLSAI